LIRDVVQHDPSEDERLLPLKNKIDYEQALWFIEVKVLKVHIDKYSKQ